MRFYGHKQLARTALSDMKILSPQQFNEVAWDQVARALEEVPRLFQLWASKQVLDIAGTNGKVSKWDESVDPRCPSCQQCTETTAHILLCDEAGRVDTFLRMTDHVETWLYSVDTDPCLVDCLMQFARGRGQTSMRSLCISLDSRFQGMARSQDKIGWRRFMEGMISRGVVEIQREYFCRHGLSWKLDRWASGLVIKLLEVTHGQWLYRNIIVHDAVAGSMALIRKETILAEIEEQMERGEDGLLDEHKYLLEVNLDDLDDSDGSTQEYWLLAIRAARVACATVAPAEEATNRPRLRPRNTLQHIAHPLDGHDYG